VAANAGAEPLRQRYNGPRMTTLPAVSSPAEQKAAAQREIDRHPFRAAWWARSGFAQTLVGSWTRGPGRGALRLERWRLPDGDFVRMHFGAPVAGAPLVLLLHGLEGSRESGYVGEMLRAVRRLGWSFAVLEFRSCGGETNRARRTYHSGETSDLGYVVERLCNLAPARPLYLVGYSLGGNVMLKWLGECGSLVPEQVVAAAAVSAPFDLEVAARQCDERYRGLIARHFLRTLVPKALAKARQFPGLLDPAAVRRCRTFAAFDDLVTAPLHGFRDALHYWRSSSCAQFLASIRRPVLLLGAEDDPLVPGRVLPRALVERSEHLVGAFPGNGGHCGFVGGKLPGWPERWAEAQVQRFFALHEAWRLAAATPSPCPSRTATSPPA
jgi:predicted alpha/beta-fold hydrolase